MKRKLVLASASPRRKEILEMMGLEFSICPACGEEILTTSDPEEAVLSLSMQKAGEVAEKQKEPSLVIGADTVVAHKGKILGKPADKADAVRMLRELSGETHMVYTGVTVLDAASGRTIVHFAEGTKVSMYPLEEEWIESYAASGEPVDKAGAYAIQGGAMPWIRGIEGEYLNVVGFPAARFYQEMRKAGLDLLKPDEEGNL